MKSKKIGFGVFLLSIGIIWVLVNFGIIDWSIFNAVYTLWPLIFVAIGVNIIFINNEIVKAVTWLLLLTVLVFYGYYTVGNIHSGEPVKSSYFAIEKLPEIERGELKLSLGFVNLDIGSNSKNLMDGTFSDPNIFNTVDYKDGKKTAVVSFTQKNKYPFPKGINTNDYDGKLSINDGVIWDISAKLGAANGVIDMSALKIGTFDADIGAGNLKLIFGDNYESTNVKIDAGAAKLDLVVPASAGVRIRTEGLLGKEDLDDLNWEKNGGYLTSPNYNEAESKINMDITMGVGELSFNSTGE